MEEAWKEGSWAPGRHGWDGEGLRGKGRRRNGKKDGSEDFPTVEPVQSSVPEWTCPGRKRKGPKRTSGIPPRVIVL